MEGSIVVLDFGGQYAHLIGNRVRRLGAFSEIRAPETSAEALQRDGVAGIILSGGPQSVYEQGSPQADPKILSLGVPVLGLCYGHQWMARVLGGEVKPGRIKEYGQRHLDIVRENALFRGLPRHCSVWMSHGDEVAAVPEDFTVTGRTPTCAVAAMAHEEKALFGAQFHLEVTHTEHGMDMLKNFLSLCKTRPWSMEGIAAHVAEDVRRQVGDKRVFMLVSGGVDSTVAFTLLNNVLGPERVQGMLVDTGLMRKGEVTMIQAAFRDLGIRNLHVEDASTEFFDALRGLYDPEQKRKAIGQTFLNVQKRVSESMNLRMEDGWMLGQGTIYPDTIETGGTTHADHIKTHHNRVEAIQAMMEAGLVVEPLKELYKDEVRLLGEELGLPHDLVWWHPFPGPGLGVRILCAQGPDTVALSADAGADWRRIPHALLPVKSVGVQGDGRTYRHALAFFPEDLPAFLTEHRSLASALPNDLPAINRVLVCTSWGARQEEQVPFFTFTPGDLTRERAECLREADHAVSVIMRSEGLYEDIWQFPVVLLPFGTRSGGQSIVLRPIHSTDAMTAHAVDLPDAALRAMTSAILAIPGIDLVFLDLTSKPPATIEWE